MTTKHDYLLESLNSIKDETMSLILDNLGLDLIITNDRYFISVDIADRKSRNAIFSNHFYTNDNVMEKDDYDTRLLYQSYKNQIIFSILAVANYDLIQNNK